MAAWLSATGIRLELPDDHPSVGPTDEDSTWTRVGDAPAPAAVVDAGPVDGAPTPAELEDDPASTMSKAELLEALEAAGATNMATLGRYGTKRLVDELGKLTTPGV